VTPAPLGGATISPIGLGSWAMGGAGWLASLGSQEDRDSLATMEAATAAGINWIDTAPYYGLGHAEEVIGRYLSGVPEDERPMVFTKCGIIWESATVEPKEILSPSSIRREVEESLRRLGVDRLDLLQVHWPATDGTPVQESWTALAELVDEGKARWIGVSNFDVELLEACERIRHVDTLQPPFSLLRRGAGSELIPWCRDHGTAVLVYSPLESGLLAGSFTRERVAGLARGDVRLEREAVFCEPALSRNLEFVAALNNVAARLGLNLAELAAAWVIAWPGVTGAILGARTPRQLRQWTRAASVHLDQESLAEIADLLLAFDVGNGPVSPEPVELR
jgi:aryl-alcohol dehydrogenase-like predicted oxidoreductase